MTHVHILRGRNFISCTFVGGESYKGYVYIKGEKTYFYKKTMFYFVFHYVCFLVFYMVLGVMFKYICIIILIASYLCVGHAYILMLLCFFGCMFA